MKIADSERVFAQPIKPELRCLSVYHVLRSLSNSSTMRIHRIMLMESSETTCGGRISCGGREREIIGTGVNGDD
jgi:hypothetical protein